MYVGPLYLYLLSIVPFHTLQFISQQRNLGETSFKQILINKDDGLHRRFALSAIRGELLERERDRERYSFGILFTDYLLSIVKIKREIEREYREKRKREIDKERERKREIESNK